MVVAKDAVEDASQALFEDFLSTLGKTERRAVDSELQALDARTLRALEIEESTLAALNELVLVHSTALDEATREEETAAAALEHAATLTQEAQQLALQLSQRPPLHPPPVPACHNDPPRSAEVGGLVKPLSFGALDRRRALASSRASSRLSERTRSSRLIALSCNWMLAATVAPAAISAVRTANAATTTAAREAAARAQAALLEAQQKRDEMSARRERAAEAMRRQSDEQAMAAERMLSRQREGAAERREARTRLMRDGTARFEGLSLEQARHPILALGPTEAEDRRHDRGPHSVSSSKPPF